MRLYHQHNIKTLEKSDKTKSSRDIQIWISIMKHGVRHYIKNADCELKLIVDKDLFLPVVIPNSKFDNSYVCSPYSQYIDYGYREIDIELSDRPVINKISKGILKAFEKCTPRHAFDKVIFVNNWFASTNLYPEITTQKLKEITEILLDQYPDRAIIFRSVSEELNIELINGLQNIGYEQIMSRQIYIVDPSKEIYKKKKAFKEDLRLQRNRKAYKWVTIDKCDDFILEKVKKFYDDLYLNKYSTINPQFTHAFFEDSINDKWLRYFFLEKEDKIHACVGYYHRNGIMTTPIIGYDFNLPQKVGLYRLISLQITQEGIKNSLIVHCSSGASTFKKVRGAQASLEYNLVYTKHLSRLRKFPWKTLKGMTKHIASPIIKKFEL